VTDTETAAKPTSYFELNNLVPNKLIVAEYFSKLSSDRRMSHLGDISDGENADSHPAPHHPSLELTVGITGVVDESRIVALLLAVHIEACVCS
jgi:hypothetical protein